MSIEVKNVDIGDGETKPILKFHDPVISQNVQRDLLERGKDRKENLDNLLFHCANPTCHKETRRADLKVCSRCKKDRYCSAACQKDHWPVHKKSCGIQSSPTKSSLGMRLVERSLAVTKIVQDLIGYAIIALDLTNDPIASQNSFFRVPVSSGEINLEGFLARVMRGEGRDPNAELGLVMKPFQIVPKEEAPEKVRKGDEDFREALRKKEGMNDALAVTYYFVPWFEGDDDTDDESEETKTSKVSASSDEGSLLMRTFVVPQYQMDKAQEGVDVTVHSNLSGQQTFQLNKENIDTLREGINNIVRMDKTNKLKLHGYLRTTSN